MKVPQGRIVGGNETYEGEVRGFSLSSKYNRNCPYDSRCPGCLRSTCMAGAGDDDDYNDNDYDEYDYNDD